jgi:hypothetical protein
MKPDALLSDKVTVKLSKLYKIYIFVIFIAPLGTPQLWSTHRSKCRMLVSVTRFGLVVEYSESPLHRTSLHSTSLQSTVPWRKCCSVTASNIVDSLPCFVFSPTTLDGLMCATRVSRPVCLGIKHPSGAYAHIFITVRQLRVLLMWGALSDERTGRSFTIAAGPRQRSHSPVRVPWGLATIFYCLGFETSIFVTTVEVLHPASTGEFFLVLPGTGLLLFMKLRGEPNRKTNPTIHLLLCVYSLPAETYFNKTLPKQWMPLWRF